MNRGISAAATVAMALAATVCHAHVSVSSGPGFANTTQEIVFGIGHGCAGMDTYRVKVEIPSGVTSVRTLTSDFGAATLEKDSSGNVTSVTWQKSDDRLLAEDSAYYKLVLRAKIPNRPFTKAYFRTVQTCKGADGGTATTEWISTAPALPDGGGAEPAPGLLILPARQPGWNKFVVPQAMGDLKEYFGDAAIVWKGNAAYSSNPNTVELIGKTSGVTALTSLEAGSEVWVKY